MSDNLEFNMSEEIAQGEYANLVVITHSSAEFILDFIRMLPNVEKPVVKSRVILGPENAKRFLMAMDDNIRKYESKYGKITLYDEDGMVPPIIGRGGKA